MLKKLFFIYLTIILYLAVTPQEVEVIKNSWDKLNHFAAFFVLYILLYFTFRKLDIFYKSLISFAFGFFIESVQYFLPNREFSLFDILADIIGIILAILVLKTLCYFINIRVKSNIFMH